MVYITGDTHAIQEKWVEQIHPVLKSGDTLIVAGDFGVGFWDGRYWSEELFYDWIAEQPYTVLFCDGNHCNFDRLKAYPISEWQGGKVHFLRRNLIHLMRGEVYDIDDQKVFVFGGGYSLDQYRREEGRDWWPQEMPSEEEYANAERNLDRCGRKVNVIITHTAPSETVYAMSTIRSLRIRNDVYKEMPLTAALDNIRRTVSYARWYYGHFHVDREMWRNQTAVFNTIREMNTGKIVRQWDIVYEEQEW